MKIIHFIVHFMISMRASSIVGDPDWNYFNGGIDWPRATNSYGGTSQSPLALDLDSSQPLVGHSFDLQLSGMVVNATFSIDQAVKLIGNFSTLNFKDTNGTLLEFDNS
jgi:hypothetical protein